MRKTTVYLPDDLKDRLGRAARRSDKSEADLVRQGVEFVVERELAPVPDLPTADLGGLAGRVDEELARRFGDDA